MVQPKPTNTCKWARAIKKKQLQKKWGCGQRKGLYASKPSLGIGVELDPTWRCDSPLTLTIISALPFWTVGCVRILFICLCRLAGERRKPVGMVVGKWIATGINSQPPTNPSLTFTFRFANELRKSKLGETNPFTSGRGYSLRSFISIVAQKVNY